MIRIPREEVEQLKHETDLAALVRASGVELAPHGANGDLIGRCLFHDDRTPSLVVSPAKGVGQPALWHCLGACGVGGSVIDWVMKVRRVGFRHAIEVLRALRGAGTSAAQPPQAAPALLRKRLPPLVSLDAGDRQLMTQVIDYYHQRLKQSPDALAYLQKRGIGSAEAIEQFKLGYADRTVGMRLPMKVTIAGAQIRGRLERLGLYRKTGREHFCGCVVFPVIDPNSGEVTEVYGRKITPRLRPGLPLHLYLPGEHKGVWNEKALAACDETILCESIIDALTFWCAGFRNVTCSYGTNGFTPDHLAAFKKHGTKRVLIAYDRDDAGEEAAQKLWPDLAAAGIECYRVQFPKWMDANEYALKLTPASKSLDLVLRKALWLGKGEPPTRAMPALMTVEYGTGLDTNPFTTGKADGWFDPTPLIFSPTIWWSNSSTLTSYNLYELNGWPVPYAGFQTNNSLVDFGVHGVPMPSVYNYPAFANDNHSQIAVDPVVLNNVESDTDVVFGELSF